MSDNTKNDYEYIKHYESIMIAVSRMNMGAIDQLLKEGNEKTSLHILSVTFGVHQHDYSKTNIIIDHLLKVDKGIAGNLLDKIVLLAVLEERTKTIGYLLTKGAKVTIGNLEFAIEKNKLESLRYLIEKRAEEIPRMKVFAEVIAIAVSGPYLATIDYLLTLKDEEISSDLIKCAAFKGDLIVLEYLVKEKNVPVIDRDIVVAVEHGHLESLKYLIKAQGRKVPDTVIEASVIKEHQEIINYLIALKDKGINEKLVLYTILTGNHILLEYLLKEQNLPVSKTNMAFAVEKREPKIIDCLLANGKNDDEHDDEYIIKGLILFAVAVEALEVIDHLLLKDEEIIDKTIRMSAYQGKLNLLRHSIEKKGTDVISEPVILGAVNGGHLNIIDYLSGINEQIANKLIETVACENKQELLRYLIEEKNVQPTTMVLGCAMEYQKMIDYLWPKQDERGKEIMMLLSIKDEKLGLLQHFIEEGAKITENVVSEAIKVGNPMMLAYLGAVAEARQLEEENEMNSTTVTYEINNSHHYHDNEL